ncbi:uncharacterized protein METZ01_LOCUS180285 [marine metagenome]|uniref:Uncharacterized protein n=1 Tax=marine metagenome TaxID=408172 RepID=A0A382CP84_9ZZZZ
MILNIDFDIYNVNKNVITALDDYKKK